MRLFVFLCLVLVASSFFINSLLENEAITVTLNVVIIVLILIGSVYLRKQKLTKS